MHRSLAIALILLIALAGVANAKAGASITAGDGEYHFGETYPTDEIVVSWTAAKGRKADFGWWARADCNVNATSIITTVTEGGRLYAQFQSLSTNVQRGGFTFGPTPSWSGGGADCTLRLYSIENGALRGPFAEDTFTVLP